MRCSGKSRTCSWVDLVGGICHELSDFKHRCNLFSLTLSSPSIKMGTTVIMPVIHTYPIVSLNTCYFFSSSFGFKSIYAYEWNSGKGLEN